MLGRWVKKSFIIGMSVSLLAPVVAQAYGESSVIQNYVDRKALVPLIKPSWGNFIIHTEPLNKLYKLRSYQAIWVDSNGMPNSMALALKNALNRAELHGLVVNDYWDSEVEGLYKSTITNQKNWITFEMAATEALIRYVTHLSVGRFDPELVDADVKYKKKEFTDFAELNNVINGGLAGLGTGLDRFMPSHPRYKELFDVLVQLKGIRDSGGWGVITSPGIQLKKGVTDPAVGQVRARLNQLGYKISNAGGNTFDQEMDDVVRLFQEKNSLAIDGVIGTRSEVLRSLNYTANQRIAQVEVTMEKLRWLPKNVEQRHIFVNLATTEFRLFDEGGKVFHFKTINGQPFRRTPSMRDMITYIDINPTWTVPHSIATKDKLPLIRQNPKYLESHNIKLYDASTDREVNPYSVDWKNMTTRGFTYYLRQMPGPDNALGVVKFPLQNPWAIYLHDTNDRHLFAEGKRHLSSGCVRLEQPLELAAYLLKDQPGWSLQEIQNFVPMTRDQKPVELEKKVTLKRPMPVYFLYLTVEKAEDGSLRFIDDVYGQDTRLSKALQNKKFGNEFF